MENISKTNNELIMSREAQALIKFRDFPNLDENQNITLDECYNPTLYKYNGYWMVDWIDNMGVSLMAFENKDVCNAIDKAYNWLQSNIFKNVTNK